MGVVKKNAVLKKVNNKVPEKKVAGKESSPVETLPNGKYRGLRGAEIVTLPFDRRGYFGVPRVTMTKREFTVIRPLDKQFLTTDVFKHLGMEEKPLVNITNKEVEALVKYRASQGKVWAYEYKGKNKELWGQVTDKHCKDYEVTMNDKIAAGLVKEIKARGGTVKKPLTMYSKRYLK